MIKAIAIVLFLFANSYVNSQNCQLSMIIDSQGTLEDYIVANSNCTSVHGDLVLSNIESLLPLQNIDSIYGSLIIKDSPSLTNLVGLDSLIYVDGLVEIMRNSNLKSVSNLNNLNTIARNTHEGEFGFCLSIASNETLDSIIGFSNLENVGLWGIKIFENQSLKIINGFGKIETIDNLWIENNPLVHSISIIILSWQF